MLAMHLLAVKAVTDNIRNFHWFKNGYKKSPPGLPKGFYMLPEIGSFSLRNKVPFGSQLVALLTYIELILRIIFHFYHKGRIISCNFPNLFLKRLNLQNVV
jgi:hypothetical protein